MKPSVTYTLLGVLTSVISFTSSCPARSLSTEDTVIVRPAKSTWAEDLAAREVRRYIYLRTGRLFPIRTELPAAPRANIILVCTKGSALLARIRGDTVGQTVNSLNPQSYVLKTLRGENEVVAAERPAPWPRMLVLAGGDDAGTLYASYRFAEKLGVRFYLDRDVIPDQQESWVLPILDIQESPLYNLRGIQP
ncbi:MAG TPA: hypothetical protein VHI52_20120, partial [Verrucomicrobiae bacterium]|nr:hypothetical protein [Verrucomicrobiae bacterium]